MMKCIFRTLKIRLSTRQFSSESSASLIRLNKFIAHTGLCSRREAERWIIDGRITVNGTKINSVCTIISSNDDVFLDGKKVNINSSKNMPKLWMVNKLKGELVSENDPIKNRPLMFHRIKQLGQLITKERILSNNRDISPFKPISRLEFNTEGLCLISNDGEFARVLGSAEAKIIRQFRVRVHGLITDSKLNGLKHGMYIDGKKQPSFDVKIEKTAGTISWLKILTTEINNKVMKNCLEKMYIDITRIIAVGFGPYKLGDLNAGGLIEVKITPELLILLET